MDNYGRNRRNWVENLWQKDNYGRLWTIGSALQNRRLQVRFLSHLPFSASFHGDSAVALASVDSSCDSSSRCRTLLARAEQRVALELITNENWEASTYWAPTMGMISSRFTCPHDHSRPHGFTLQNGG